MTATALYRESVAAWGYRAALFAILSGLLILFHGCHVGGHDEDLLKVIQPWLLAR